MDKSKIKNLLKNEYVFSLIAKAFMVVIGLAESALLARYLGASLRGDLSYIYSLASTAYLLITLGIYTAYPFKRKGCENVKGLLDEFMTVSTVLFAGYAVLMFSAAVLMFNTYPFIAAMLFMLPVMGYDKIVSFTFMIENPNGSNSVTVFVNIVQVAYLAVLALFFPANLYAGIWYYLLGCIIKTVWFLGRLKFHFSLKLFSFGKLVSYIRFGFFPMITLLLTTLNYRLDVIMLGQFDYISSAEIGVYSIGIGLAEKTLLIPDAIKDVLLSKLSKGKKEDEVARAMRCCFAASILTAVAITVFGGLVIDILYGAEYEGAEIITYISVWGTVTMALFKMVSQYNVVEHKQHLNVVFLSIAIVLNFTLNMTLIPVFGINGAALATAIGYCVSSGIFVAYFHKASGIPVSKMVFMQKEDLQIVKRIIKK